MKRYIFTLLMMASFAGFSYANNTENKSEKKANPTVLAPAEITPAATIKQLQDENNLLKQQLIALYNENEELKGTLSFHRAMSSMFASIGQQKQNELLEEINATIGYNNMMANMLLKLKQNSK